MQYDVALVREHRERQMRLVFGSMAKLSPFALFTPERGCPCLENRFAEQTGKTVKRGFGVSPKLFSFLSFGYKREDENKKWEIKKQSI